MRNVFLDTLNSSELASLECICVLYLEIFVLLLMLTLTKDFNSYTALQKLKYDQFLTSGFKKKGTEKQKIGENVH